MIPIPSGVRVWLATGHTDMRCGFPSLALRVQESGRTGWYYRVIEEGTVRAGDPLQLVERAHADWSLSRLSAVLFDRRVEPELLRECLALPLVPSWRRTLERRLEKAEVEDWAPRLQGAGVAQQGS